MDQFFIEIYESIVYQWIVMNQNTYKKSGIHFHIDQNDPNKLVFISDELKGDIYFWTNHHIIEETIVNKDGDITFYLHFRIINLASTKKFIQNLQTVSTTWTVKSTESLVLLLDVPLPETVIQRSVP